MTAGAVSVAAGLALAWDAVEPAVVRAVPTGGFVLIVAMVVLPLTLLALAGAATLKHRGAADADGDQLLLDFDGARPHGAGVISAAGVVRHESHGGDRHERPHSHRTGRSRGVIRAGGTGNGIEAGDGLTEA